MDKFLKKEDQLGVLIQEAAAGLFNRLKVLDVDKLDLPYHCLHYYKSSHSRRLFFSIETSAHLLYRSISMCGKTPSEIILMDYGAGVGTLYLLAKLIGCKKVIYNDHLEDWKKSAQSIANAINIQINEYIVGDIGDCLHRLDENGIKCDLIISRNVVEHIYKLDVFYSCVFRKQPNSIIFSSTTANIKNPAAVLKHILWHRKWEKVYQGKRMVFIQRQSPGMSAERVKALAKSTRGLALSDLENAIDDFRKTGVKPDSSEFRSNTCDPANGVWAEDLLSFEQYRQFIDETRYEVRFEAGFWDTHYRNNFMNFAGRLLNRIISQGGSLSMAVAPFIYVIAVPVSRK
ncbi:MAG: hypothetical protein ABI415_05010 [Flavitalea sp.]